MPIEPEISVFRPDRPGIRKVLGDLEAEIMELIWTHQPDEGITVRDVFATLYQQRQIAYTTVMKTMTRLAKKQLLRVEKQELVEASSHVPVGVHNDSDTPCEKACPIFAWIAHPAYSP